jgi:hypothetical protein
MKKAQAAMEYLMTYGWAILIIIVVIAALYAMGVFKTKGSNPCSPCFSYFAFVDHNDTDLIIENGPNTIDNVAVTGGSLGSGPFDPGKTLDINITPFLAPHTVTITYDIVGGAAGHSDTAVLH